MTVASLVVNLTANAAEFHRQFQKAAERADRFGRQLAKAGREISQAISLPLIAAGLGAFKIALDESHRSFGPLFTAFEQLKAHFREAGLSIGQQLTPLFLQLIAVAQQVVVWIQSLIRAFSELPPRVQHAITTTLLFLAALGPTVLVVGKLIQALAAIPKILSLLTSPLGLTVLAIVALAAAGLYVVTHWEQVKIRMVLLWTAIKEVVFDAVSAMLGALAFITTNVPGLGKALAELKDRFDAWADQSIAKTVARLAELEKQLGNSKKGVADFTLMTNDAKKVTDDFKRSIQELNDLAIAMGPTFNFAAGHSANLKAMLDGLIKTGSLSVQQLQALGQQILETARNGDFFAKTMQTIQTTVGDAFIALGERFGDLFSGLTHGFSGFQKTLAGILGSMLTTLGQAMIAFGTAGLAIKTFLHNPLAAIAAGVALVALGKALSNVAQSVVDNPPTGAGGGGGGSSVSSPSGGGTGPGEGTIILELHGDEVVGALFRDPRNQDALAEALFDMSGRNVIIRPATA